MGIMEVGSVYYSVDISTSKFEEKLKKLEKQIDAVNNSIMSPSVDLSGLHQLNRLLDVKIAHLAATRKAANIPITPSVNVSNLGVLRQELKNTTQAHNKASDVLQDNAIAPEINTKNLNQLKIQYDEVVSYHTKTKEKILANRIAPSIDSSGLTQLKQDLDSVTGNYSVAINTQHKRGSSDNSKQVGGVASMLAIELLSQILTAIRESAQNREGFLAKAFAAPAAFLKNYSAGTAYSLADISVRNSFRSFDKETGMNATETFGAFQGKMAGKAVSTAQKNINTHLQTNAGQQGISDIKQASQDASASLERLTRTLDEFYSTGSSSSAQEAASQMLEVIESYAKVGTLPVDALVKARKELRSPVSIEEAKTKAESISFNTPDLEKAKKIIFVSGGFAGKGGEGSKDIANAVRDAITQEGVIVVPVENKETDLSVSVGENPLQWAGEAIAQPTGQGLAGENKDAVTMLANAIAARKINPDADISFVGYSGGGFVSEEATRLANQAGLGRVSGTALATPGLIGKTAPANFSAYIGEKDPLRLAELALKPVALSSPNTPIEGIASHSFSAYIENDKVIEIILGNIKDIAEVTKNLDEAIFDGGALQDSLDVLEEMHSTIQATKELIPVDPIELISPLDASDQILPTARLPRDTLPHQRAQSNGQLSDSVPVMTATRDLKNVIKRDRNFKDIKVVQDKTKSIRDWFSAKYQEIKQLVDTGDLEQAKQESLKLIAAKNQAKTDLDELLKVLQSAGEPTSIASGGAGASIQSAKGFVTAQGGRAEGQLEKIKQLQAKPIASQLENAFNVKTDLGKKLVKKASLQIISGSNKQEIEKALQKLLTSIDPIAQNKGSLKGIGKDIIEGIKVGLLDEEGNLTDEMKAIAEALPSTVKDALGIKSPSRVFMEIGRNVGLGFVGGLTILYEGMNKAKDRVNDFVDSIENKGKDTVNNKINAQVSKLKDVVSNIGKLAVGAVLSATSVNIFQGLIEEGKKGLVLFKEVTKTLNTLKALSFPAPEDSLARIKTLADSLGTNALVLQKNFAGLQAAFNFTDLKGQTAQILEGFAVGGAALGLDKESFNGILFAVQQMGSKGVVSLEELRLQLGERLPTAISQSAQAMGISQAQFLKMVESGEVLASDLLPKLSKRMKDAFSIGAEQNKNTFVGQMSLLESNLEQISIGFGEFAANILNVVLPPLNQLTATIAKNGKAIPEIIAVIGSSVGALGLTILATSGIVQKAFSLMIAALTKFSVVSLAALSEAIATTGLFVVLGVSIYGAVKALEYFNSMGSKALKDLAKTTRVSVDFINSELARLKPPVFKVKIEQDKTLMEKFLDHYINTFNYRRQGDRRLNTDLISVEEMKTLKELEDKGKALNELMTEIRLKTQNLFDKKETQRYIGDISKLQQQLDDIKTTIRIINQTGNLSADDARVKDLNKKFNGNADAAIEFLNQNSQALSTRIEDVQFEFIPQGEDGLKQSIERAKEIRNELGRIGDSQGVQEVTNYINLLARSLAAAKKASEDLNKEVKSISTQFLRDTTQITNQDYALQVKRIQSQIQIAKSSLDALRNKEGEFKSAKQSMSSQQQILKQEELFYRERLNIRKRFISSFSNNTKRELESGLGSSLDSASTGDIDRAQETLKDANGQVPVQLQKGLDALRDILETQELINKNILDRINLEKESFLLEKQRKSDLRDFANQQRDYTFAAQDFYTAQQESQISLQRSRDALVQQRIDYALAIENFNRQAEREVRGFAEQYSDMITSLTTTFNQIKQQLKEVETENNRLTKKIAFDSQLERGSGSFVKDLSDFLNEQFSKLDDANLNTERLKLDQNQATQQLTQSMRELRNLQEAIADSQRSRAEQMRSLEQQRIGLMNATIDLQRQEEAARKDQIRSAIQLKDQFISLKQRAEELGVSLTKAANQAGNFSIPSGDRLPVPSNAAMPFSRGRGQLPPPPPLGRGGISGAKGSEMDLFKRLIIAEAKSEGLVGQALVARAVLNRQALIKSGKVTGGTYNARSGSLNDIIMGRGQFEPVSNGSINRRLTQSQLKQAEAAIALALNTEELAKAVGNNRKLLGATGFRTPSAFNDPSQNFSRTRYRGHVFNQDRFSQRLDVIGIFDKTIKAMPLAVSTAIARTTQAKPVAVSTPKTQTVKVKVQVETSGNKKFDDLLMRSGLADNWEGFTEIRDIPANSQSPSLSSSFPRVAASPASDLINKQFESQKQLNQAQLENSELKEKQALIEIENALADRIRDRAEYLRDTKESLQEQVRTARELVAVETQSLTKQDLIRQAGDEVGRQYQSQRRELERSLELIKRQTRDKSELIKEKEAEADLYVQRGLSAKLVNDLIKTELQAFRELEEQALDLKSALDALNATEQRARGFAERNRRRELNLQEAGDRSNSRADRLEAEAGISGDPFSAIANRNEAARLRIDSRFQEDTFDLDRKLADGLITPDTYSAIADDLERMRDIDLTNAFVEANPYAQELSNTLGQLFEDAFTGFKNVGEIAGNFFKSIGKMLLQMALQAAVFRIFGMFAGVGGGSVPSGGGGMGFTPNLGIAKLGGTVTKDGVRNYFMGGKVDGRSPQDIYALGISVADAMRREGVGATPIVAHRGEEVLTTRNGDAGFFRHLRSTGDWQKMKMNRARPNYSVANFFSGGTVGKSANQFVRRSGGDRSQPITNTTVFNITTPNPDGFRKSQKQIDRAEQLRRDRNSRKPD